ncbi:MAG: hypothetical protein Q9202_007348 [Teloschistes flavicans]
MEHSFIPPNDIEKALSQYCAPPVRQKKSFHSGSISDSTFKRIAELLAHLESHDGHQGWKTRPRTYTVLRNIRRLDLFPHFINHGLNDIAFPYTIDKLPDQIHEDGLRDEFLRHQRYVLTDASQLENGRHAYTKDGADLFYVGKYLGRGGSVDQVWSRMSLRCFARKQFLRKKSAKDDQAVLKRFEHELSSLKRLSHEHLVKMIGSYTDKRTFAFIMDLVADMNLYTLLERYEQVHHEWAPSLRSYFGCLANAVGYLHSQRIRHRDLKPENILIKDFKVYIADFGSALDWSHAMIDTTADANVPITARYMAPEVANWQPRNSASDMWSLGVVYLEMLTVLLGQSLRTMRKFMEDNGTKHPFVYGNPPATTLWFEQLRRGNAGSDSDNEPLTWIKDLTQPNPERRPKPWTLTSQIRHSASSTAFIGICCGDDDEVYESESPPSWSDAGEDADSVSLSQPPEASQPAGRPFGSQVLPSQRSSVEYWLSVNSTTSIADLPRPITVLEQRAFEEPYQIFEDESITAVLDDSQCQKPAAKRLQQDRVLETCVGYEITEDGSDHDEGTGPLGYKVTEDSSDSEPIIRSSSPGNVARSLQVPVHERHGTSTPDDKSVCAIIEQLDSVPEIPDLSPPLIPRTSIPTTSGNNDQISSLATTVCKDAQIPTVATIYERPSHPHGRSFSRSSEIDGRSTASRSLPQPPAPPITDDAVDLDDQIPCSYILPPPSGKRKSVHFSPDPARPPLYIYVPERPAPSRRVPLPTTQYVPNRKSVHFSPDIVGPPPSMAERPAPSRRVPLPTTQYIPNLNNDETEQNIARWLSSSVQPSQSSRPLSSSVSLDFFAGMTAELYMREVWEAASTIDTSVLSVGSRKQFSQLGSAIVRQDRHMHFVEKYAEAGKAGAVRELLQAGCNPGTRKIPNYRPLINAVRAGTQRHNKVVKALLDHGADVNVTHPRTGKTALQFAIENDNFPGYTNLIRNLLEHAANPNALDKNKDGPLLQILYGGYNPLEKHKRDALACLLQPHLDTDVNIRSLGTADMPIHLAVRRHDAIAVGILIHKGSTVNDRNGAGVTPLQIAASSWKENCPETEMDLLRYLLEGGANRIVNEARGNDKDTALHLAASRGCVQAVRILLSHGADGCLKNGKGKTAVDVAKANKSKMSEQAYTAILDKLIRVTAD